MSLADCDLMLRRVRLNGLPFACRHQAEMSIHQSFVSPLPHPARCSIVILNRPIVILHGPSVIPNRPSVILNGTKWSEGSVTDSSLTLRMTERRSAPVILNGTKWSEGSVTVPQITLIDVGEHLRDTFHTFLCYGCVQDATF